MKVKEKNAISLIVLVITILVLSILAATVIISLSNTNVISQANDSVDKYNKKQYEDKLNIAYASWMLDNVGKTFNEENISDLGNYDFDSSVLPDGYKVVVKDGVPQLLKVDVWDGVSVATSFSSGTGTKEDPYIISTAAELAYLSYIENAGTATKSAYYKLVNNIDLNNKEFTPINFTGYFLGDNYTIFNLNINVPNGSASLFGYMDGYIDNNYVGTTGGVYDVTISGGTITGKYAAGICSSAAAMDVSGCCNAGVKIVALGGNAAGIGLGGEYMTYSNCTNYGEVTGPSAVGITSSKGIGGGAFKCYNYGDITATTGYAAGIGEVSISSSGKCYNYGNVHGVTAAAGISTTEDSGEKDCYNYGNVTVESGGTIYTYHEITD